MKIWSTFIEIHRWSYDLVAKVFAKDSISIESTWRSFTEITNVHTRNAHYFGCLIVDFIVIYFCSVSFPLVRRLDFSILFI